MSIAGTSRQRGISLIELIMFIVIVSVALGGVMMVMNQITGHSADALLRKQAQTLAEAVLEEIKAQPVSGITPTNITLARNRVVSLSGLADYSASAVSDPRGWNNIPATSAVRITVTVTDPVGQAAVVAGYRTAY